MTYDIFVFEYVKPSPAKNAIIFVKPNSSPCGGRLKTWETRDDQIMEWMRNHDITLELKEKLPFLTLYKVKADEDQEPHIKMMWWR